MITLKFAGIKSIEFCAADSITLYPAKFLKPGDSTAINATWTKLNLVLLASCTTNNELTDNGTIYNNQIFGALYDNENATADRLNLLANKFHVYRITDMDNNKFLIGTDQKPHPEFLYTYQNPDSPDGQRYITIEINWKSTLLPVLIRNF